MKISKWSYEVESGPLEPVYVYEAPVRFWHWAQAFMFVMLCVTGFLIGWPPPANYADTWETYLFANIIDIHLICGMIFVVLTLYRIYWAFVGNKYSRMIFILPFWSGRWWKGLWGCVLYYLFLNKHPKEYVGHNPLAQTAMCLIYIVGTILICITGLGLFAQQWGWDSGWMKYFGWVTDWMGSASAVRTFHHLLMYYLLIFLCAHLYMAMRGDIMDGATQVSTIINGIRFFKQPVYSTKAIGQAAPHFPAIDLEKAKEEIEHVEEVIEGAATQALEGGATQAKPSHPTTHHKGGKTPPRHKEKTAPAPSNG